MYSTTEQTTVLLWKKIFPNTGLNTRVGQRDPFYCADVKALVVGNGDLSDNRCHVWRSIRPGYLLLHMWEAHGVGGGSSDVSRRDKSLRVRARVHAHHNGFFDMWSFTRGQKVMGEKAKTESSKSISHFRNHISSRHDSSLPRGFLKYKHAGINLKHWYVFGIGLVCTMQNFIFYKNLIDDSIALSAQKKNQKNTILNQKNSIKFIWR